MNTRIQVEHPVTEMDHRHRSRRARCSGSPAARRSASRQADIAMRGHAIEVRHQRRGSGQRTSCRSPGTSTALRMPGGPGVRFDIDALCRLCHPAVLRFAARQADRLGRGPRPCARAAEARARRAARSPGVKTTAPLFRALADDADVRGGDVHTRWLEHWLAANASTALTRRRRHDDSPIQLWRRRAHLRRGRRGDVARGVLQEPLDHQRRARRARSRA